MYALCTGHPPFRADTIYGVMQRIVHDEPRSIREHNPSIPDWLDQFIGRLLSKDRAGRFETANDVVGLLQEYVAHMQRPEAVPAPPRSWARRTGSFSPPASRRRRIAGVLVIAAILWSVYVSFWKAFITQHPADEQSDRSARDLPGSPADRLPTIALWNADGTKELHAATERLQLSWRNPSPAVVPDPWSKQIDGCADATLRLSADLQLTRSFRSSSTDP